MRTNAEEVHLLFEDPGKLILQYERMIYAIVQLQIGKGMIAREDKNEVVQYVFDALFERLANIREQYNGQALLRTYCAAVIRNLCKDWARVNRRDQCVRLVREVAMDPYGGINPLYQTVIQDEMRYFGKILSMFGPASAKLVLFLKAYFRLPLYSCDLLAYAPSMPEEEVDKYLQLLGHAKKTKDLEVYYILYDLVLRFEYRQNSPDAVRKWVKARILDIVRLMNNGRSTRYEPETIQILAERFFMGNAMDSRGLSFTQQDYNPVHDV